MSSEGGARVTQRREKKPTRLPMLRVEKRENSRLGRPEIEENREKGGVRGRERGRRRSEDGSQREKMRSACATSSFPWLRNVSRSNTRTFDPVRLSFETDPCVEEAKRIANPRRLFSTSLTDIASSYAARIPS